MPKFIYPDKPSPKGSCHHCGKPTVKKVGTALWCNLECRNTYYGIPDTEELMRQEMDGIVETPDGCFVEPDGTCEHGHKAWVRLLGLI